MDTSLEYIKQCEKAEEIQSQQTKCFLHKSGMGQVCHGLNGDFFWGKPTDTITEPFVVPMPICIWLPRQDQLQAMIELTGYRFTFYQAWSETEPKRLEWHGERHIGQWFVDGTSLEQLWLAFVMSELHNKQWNGSDWVLCQQ